MELCLFDHPSSVDLGGSAVLVVVLVVLVVLVVRQQNRCKYCKCCRSHWPSGETPVLKVESSSVGKVVTHMHTGAALLHMSIRIGPLFRLRYLEAVTVSFTALSRPHTHTQTHRESGLRRG